MYYIWRHHLDPFWSSWEKSISVGFMFQIYEAWYLIKISEGSVESEKLGINEKRIANDFPEIAKKKMSFMIASFSTNENVYKLSNSWLQIYGAFDPEAQINN